MPQRVQRRSPGRRSRARRRHGGNVSRRGPQQPGPRHVTRNTQRDNRWNQSTASRKTLPADQRLRISVLAAAGVMTLLGVTAALAIAGVTRHFGNVFQAGGPSQGAVVAGALAAVGLGLRVPQRFAIWLCALAWQRFVRRGKTSSVSGVLIRPAPADRPLYWVVLSVITVVAGVLTALMPWNVRLAHRAYLWLHAHFVWSDVILVVLHGVLAFLVVLVPLAMLGLAVSCSHHLSCRHSRWEPRATAWLLVGAGGGTLIATWIQASWGGGGLTLLSAALPALLVSLIAVALSATDGASAEVEPESMPLPMSSDKYPTLLRAGVVLLGAAAVGVITIWVRGYAQDPGTIGTGLAGMLLAVGGGALAGAPSEDAGVRSIGGFGAACGVAGLLLAGAALVIANGIVSSPAGVGLVACTSLAAIGFAAAYGTETLLHRVASRSSAGASILARTLIFGALAGPLAAPVWGGWIRQSSLLLLVALALLVLAGTLLLHEPGYSLKRRQAHLEAA